MTFNNRSLSLLPSSVFDLIIFS